MTARPGDIGHCLRAFDDLVMASTFIRAYSLTCEDFSRKESELGLERLSGVCSASLYIYRMIKELAGISFATAMDYPELPWDEIFHSSERMDRTCPALDSALLWELWSSVGGEKAAAFCRSFAAAQGVKLNNPDR